VSAVLRASKIMRVSRAHPGVFARYHRGDPGFLDGLWNGIKGAATGFLAGGPIGAVLGGTQGLVSGSSKKSVGGKIGGFAGSMLGKLTANRTSSMPGAGVALAAPVSVATAGIFGFGDPTKPKPPLMPGADGRDTDGGIPGPGEWMAGMGVRHKSAYSNGGCPAGYHPNKTGYYTKQGYVAAGTQCVRNRKRNPLNPRAASRALSRLTGTKKAMKSIDRMMNKIGGGSRSVRVSSFGKRKRGGCGCK
jgi:hypothetical protein